MQTTCGDGGGKWSAAERRACEASGILGEVAFAGSNNQGVSGGVRKVQTTMLVADVCYVRA